MDVKVFEQILLRIPIIFLSVFGPVMFNVHLSSIRGVDSVLIRGRSSALTSSNLTKRNEDGKREEKWL